MARFEDAVFQLRERIMSGQLKPGDRIVEEEIAAELGMSRSPVREAVRALTSEGLVEVTRNRGARVTAWSTDEVDAVFEVRVRLEGLAARRAAERITADEVDELDAIARQIQQLGESKTERYLPEVQRLNAELHQGIIRIAGSSILASAVAGVVHAAVLNRTRESFDDEQQARSDRQHLEIVAALRAGDGDWAESVMRSHLQSARASLLGPRRELEDA